jgi:hypothetical protein
MPSYVDSHNFHKNFNLVKLKDTSTEQLLSLNTASIIETYLLPLKNLTALELLVEFAELNQFLTTGTKASLTSPLTSPFYLRTR